VRIYGGGWSGETSPYPEIYYITIHLWLAITAVRWQQSCSGQGVDNVRKAWPLVLKNILNTILYGNLRSVIWFLYTSKYWESFYVHMKTSGTSIFSVLNVFK
jgi:hypothetical protein